MTSPEDSDFEPREEAPGLRARLAGQAEDAIGKLADDLLENPMVSSALSSAFSAREKMAHAQQQAMGALNLPSASDIEKLARRVRSVSQRLEELEDGIERVSERIADLTSASRSAEDLSARLDRIEQRLDRIGKQVAAGQRTVDDTVRAADVVGPTG
jgi:septal ring factor EnvC (AmiA/AmiB activator)